MDSNLSRFLANIFMEHFETHLIKDIPVEYRPLSWFRFVDDVICCYKDMAKFNDFLTLLNGVRPTIQFTYELSRTERTLSGTTDLPDDIVEAIPFLELLVMRRTNGNFTFSIYRKPCHAENYLHAYSYQPLSQNTTVVRSLFLRAYRFCDTQFIKKEEHHIKQSFLELSYTEKFIEKCRISAYKGRINEIKKGNLAALQDLPFAIHTITQSVKQEYLATLTLPYHPCILRLQPRLSEMGIRLSFSSNSKLQQQLRRKSGIGEQPKGSVYVTNCTGCTEVYIGQTGKHVSDRMEEHRRTSSNELKGAVYKHNKIPGHFMDLKNPTKVYSSDCYQTRVTIESALIHVAPTVQSNTSTSSNNSNILVASTICRSAKLNWENLARCIPQFDLKAVPPHKKSLYGSHVPLVRPPPETSSQPPGTPVAARTRHGVIGRPFQHISLEI